MLQRYPDINGQAVPVTAHLLICEFFPSADCYQYGSLADELLVLACRNESFTDICISDNYEEEYRVLRSELESFSREISRKPHIIAMSKMDVADEEVAEKISAFEKSLETTVLTFSSVSRTGLSELKDSMWEMLQRANDGE